MQSASSIWSNLSSNSTVNIIEIVRNCVRGGEANVYGSSYYWNFGASSFGRVACLILAKNLLTGSLKNRSIDNLETQKKSISMKNSQFFDYLLYAKSK